MKVLGVVFVAMLAVGGFGSPVVAGNDLVFSDQQTATCLAEAELESEQRNCIGQSADACVNANDLGQSTIGSAGCLSMELEYWDTQLNDAYSQAKIAMAQVDTDNEVEKYGMLSSVETLRDMQRAWIPYRDARCLFETATWGQGTGAPGAHTACMMVVTAEQTLLLMGMGGGY